MARTIGSVGSARARSPVKKPKPPPNNPRLSRGALNRSREGAAEPEPGGEKACVRTKQAGFTRARIPVPEKTTGFAKPKGTVKTIECHDPSELIHCVDIFKQPAFDNPLLKNHILLYAPVSFPGSTCRAARANVNVWNPTILDNEVSFAQTWVVAGQNEDLNTIEFGWTVSKAPNFGKQTRSFIIWTSDNYQKTGCFNLDCPGFVQVDRRITLGTPLQPIPSYNGDQSEVYTSVTQIDRMMLIVFIWMPQDPATGHWWLRYKNVDVGYCPKEIFTTLSTGADGMKDKDARYGVNFFYGGPGYSDLCLK
ncbi:uncharacterized protein LOC104424142 [Eucalyptus grandis]|uniref:uncharacterized protein LOC104424142 n=1 Tax=Eucalyptus grandis TaxID=71139 RepID=UPI00192EEC44|nr:uncharacterized protein LOC104424142 [Eucalyptus grandis]